METQILVGIEGKNCKFSRTPPVSALVCTHAYVVALRAGCRAVGDTQSVETDNTVQPVTLDGAELR